MADAYHFICNRIMEVPCIRLASKLWEKYAKAKHSHPTGNVKKGWNIAHVNLPHGRCE